MPKVERKTKNLPLSAQLRDYQKPKHTKALSILNKWNFVYLWYECRTGKTISSLMLAEDYGAKNVIICSPISAHKSILSDYDDGNYSFNLLICNPESLSKITDEEIEVCDLVISDEHHMMSGSLPNSNSKIDNLKKITWDKPLICLSGTPTPEGDWQLWNQFSVTKYSPFRKYYNVFHWIKEYITVETRPKKKSIVSFKNDFISNNNLSKLLVDNKLPKANNSEEYRKVRDFVYKEEVTKTSLNMLSGRWWEYVNKFTSNNSPFSNHNQLRRSTFNEYKKIKEDKKELLKLLREMFFVHLTQEEAGFSSVKEEIADYVMMEKSYEIESIIQSLVSIGQYSNSKFSIPFSEGAAIKQKIHQLSSGTIKSDDQYIIIDPSKALYIRDKYSDVKKVIYYLYIAEFELLKKVFPDWTNSPEEFQENPNKVFLGQFKSKSKGVKLSNADYQFMFNVPHSAEAYMQSKERLLDYDRDTPAKIIWLLNASSYAIDSDIYDMVKNKERDFTLSHYRKKYGNFF